MQAMTEKLLDKQDVMEMLGISESSFFRMMKRGELPGFKVGRDWKFTAQDMQRYINVKRKLHGKTV